MQISWQAQRSVKLEVQISCRHLGRASKPKSHPGKLYINFFIKLVSTIEKSSGSKGLPFPLTKTFIKIMIHH